MLPWSVMPTAGMPPRTAAVTTSSMRDAPSSIEYSVCRCRWTNESLMLLAPLAPGCPLSTGAVDLAVDESHGCHSYREDRRVGPRAQGLHCSRGACARDCRE